MEGSVDFQGRLRISLRQGYGGHPNRPDLNTSYRVTNPTCSRILSHQRKFGLVGENGIKRPNIHPALRESYSATRTSGPVADF